jgi:septal ring factor EnvC (AmiA/AmiB activator)
MFQTHGGDSDIVVKSLERKVDELLKNIQEIREEKENIAREQDDLLVLLSDHDAKCAKYKVRVSQPVQTQTKKLATWKTWHILQMV